jgi:hypothetical protein
MATNLGLTTIFPKRVLPRFRMQFMTDLQRVTIHGYAYAPDNLVEVELTPKYLCTFQRKVDGAMAELYAFLDGADIEALVSVCKDAKGAINWEAGRMGGRKMEISFDSSLVETWPELDPRGYWIHGEAAPTA